MQNNTIAHDDRQIETKCVTDKTKNNNNRPFDFYNNMNNDDDNTFNESKKLNLPVVGIFAYPFPINDQFHGIYVVVPILRD